MLLLFTLRTASVPPLSIPNCTANEAIMHSRKAYLARLSKMYNVTPFISFTSQLICPLHSKTRAFLAHLNIRISEQGKTNHQQYNSDSSHAQEVGPVHAEEDRVAVQVENRE